LRMSATKVGVAEGVERLITWVEAHRALFTT
jgi:hypothetical protein